MMKMKLKVMGVVLFFFIDGEVLVYVLVLYVLCSCYDRVMVVLSLCYLQRGSYVHVAAYHRKSLKE